MPGFPVPLSQVRPSGAAVTVPRPLRTNVQRWSLAKGPGCRHPVLDGEGTPRQPGKFPGVRGQDRGRPPSVQTIYMPGQGIYAIGVQHHWYLQVT